LELQAETGSFIHFLLHFVLGQKKQLGFGPKTHKTMMGRWDRLCKWLLALFTVRRAEMHKKKQSPKLDFGAEEAEVGLAATKYLRCSPL
jgi:hypothetical protein